MKTASSSFSSRLYICAGLIAFGLAAAAAFGEMEFQVVDLGTLGGATSEAHGINNRGEVVGWAQDAGGHTQAFQWQYGSMTGLGFLPGGSNS